MAFLSLSWSRFLLCSSLARVVWAASNGFSYVDPLIGTNNGGHVFPGATLPFGMAKAVADNTGESQGGTVLEKTNLHILI